MHWHILSVDHVFAQTRLKWKLVTKKNTGRWEGCTVHVIALKEDKWKSIKHFVSWESCYSVASRSCAQSVLCCVYAWRVWFGFSSPLLIYAFSKYRFCFWIQRVVRNAKATLTDIHNTELMVDWVTRCRSSTYAGRICACGVPRCRVVVSVDFEYLWDLYGPLSLLNLCIKLDTSVNMTST